MKKRILIILIICILAVILVFFVTSKSKKYTVVVSLIDDYSPDRLLTVYNTNNEKIKVKRIEYKDGKLLCKGDVTAVHFTDIDDINEVKVILEDDSEIKAIVVKEEVKNK